MINEYLVYKERLRYLDLFSLEKRGIRRILAMYCHGLKEKENWKVFFVTSIALGKCELPEPHKRV